MGTIRTRSRRRLVGGLAIILLASTAAAGPVSAGRQRAIEPAAAPLLEHHGKPSADPRERTVRRINVRELAGSVEGPKELPSGEAGPGPATPPTNQATSGAGILAAPPTDLGTTNGSAAPMLTKLGLTEGHDNLPNPTVAVGPDHVIRSDHGVMRITNRSGGAAIEISYAEFFGNGMVPGPNHKQGQVFFDPVHGRWVAIDVNHHCSAFNGQYFAWLNFAVSTTGDPWWEWDLYSYFQEGVYLSDPGFGTSGDKLLLTSRALGMAANCGSTAYDAWDATTIAWDDLISGSFKETYFPFPETADARIDKLSPALRRDTASDTLEVVAIIFDHGSLDQTTELWRFDGPGSDTAIEPVELTPDVIPDIEPGIHVTQGTGPGFTPAFGPTSVVAQDDRLVFTATQPCTPAGDSTARNCARIVDLDTSTQVPTRLQDFFIGRNGRHTFSAGADFSATDDLYITYQRASDSAGPSSHVVRQSPTDPPGTVSPSQALASPLNYYQNLNAAERIGLSPDPQVPDAVWVINQSGRSIDPDPYAYNLQVAQARSSTGNTYVPITPYRVFDTRTLGGNIEDFFWSDVPKAFDVAGVGPIPADAVAITGNLTVVMQSSGGYVSVGPTVSATPTSSTINFPANEERANNVTVPLNTDGDLMAVFKGSAPDRATGLILDVTGYFVADDSGATYEPITSSRVLDTRFGTGLSGRFVVNVPRTLQVAGVGLVPPGAKAVTGNLTVVGQTRRGYVSLTPTPDADPETSTINFPLGDTRANGVTVQLSDEGKLSAVYKAPGGTTDLIFDVTGYYVEDLSGLRFYPLNPGRIMDSRFVMNQLFGQFSNSVPRTLVTGGHFGAPADALAVTGNLTVVGQTKAGYVSITKNPDATPPVSVLNFPLGDIRANGVTVPLNASNDMAIVYKATSGAKTHLILDLTGYFK